MRKSFRNIVGKALSVWKFPQIMFLWVADNKLVIKTGEHIQISLNREMVLLLPIK